MPSTINNTTCTSRPICHIFTPIGMLGYGFDEREMHETLQELSSDGVPTALILDSGSTDSGPRKLAMGDMSCPRSAYKRDLGKLLRGVQNYKVPILIGSAGGAGINKHVDELTNIVEEWSQEQGYPLKTVQIYSEISKDLVSQRMKAGQISGCGSAVPPMQQSDIDECTVIVGQMGPEPYLEAMEDRPDFDVILGGRAYDPSPYIAFMLASLSKVDPNFEFDKVKASTVYGGFWHAAKILECGGICTTPKQVLSKGAVGTIYSDGSFQIAPTDSESRCTPLSVASHTLYEKTRPDIHHGPGGWLDLNDSYYEQLPDNRTVRVRGSVFYSSTGAGKSYQVKLEAARKKGYRTMYMGIHRDPILIRQIDSFLDNIKQYVRKQVDGLVEGEWDLEYHVHGQDESQPKSLFLVAEARAETQDLANAIASAARVGSTHASYPGQKATSGNMGFGICGTTEVQLGPYSEFCIYHLMDLLPGEEKSLFRMDSRSIGGARVVDPKPIPNGVSKTNGAEKSKTNGGTPKANKGTTTVVDTKDPKTIYDVAKILRSKNAGPYEITLDVMFDRKDVYDAIKFSGLLTTECIATLYDLNPEQVIWSGFFDQALAFKATIPRMRHGVPASSGSFLEDDVQGAQQYGPIMLLELPEELRQRLKALT